MSEELRIQVSMTVKKPKGVKVPREVMEAAFLQWVQTGRSPKGFKVNAVIWQNPHRGKKTQARWRVHPDSDMRIAKKLAGGETLSHRSGTMSDARKSLNQAGLLRQVTFQSIR